MKNVIAFAVILFFTACESKPDLEKEKMAILTLLQTERKAHFENNVELFMAEFSKEMISVNKGIVTMKTEEENRQRIGSYFGSVKFIKWDDSAEPIIRISDDGNLGYAIVQKDVILSRKDSLGQTRIDSTHFAWASIYRKLKGGWKVECNVSTNK